MNGFTCAIANLEGLRLTFKVCHVTGWLLLVVENNVYDFKQ